LRRESWPVHVHIMHMGPNPGQGYRGGEA
jgi:hypothetical protein